jgi:hypothetical protein
LDTFFTFLRLERRPAFAGVRPTRVRAEEWVDRRLVFFFVPGFTEPSLPLRNDLRADFPNPF